MWKISAITERDLQRTQGEEQSKVKEQAGREGDTRRGQYRHTETHWAEKGTEKNSEGGGERGKVIKREETEWFKINMAVTQGHSDSVND